MAFFYQQTKAQAARVKTVKSGKPMGLPIGTLQKMGCAGCPRDKYKDLKSPKIRPVGTDSPLIYILGYSPSEVDDNKDEPFADHIHRTLLRQFDHKVLDRDVRMGTVMQCHEPDPKSKSNEVAMICCKPRVVGDIEESRPIVVLGVGAQVLSWATGMGGGVGMRRGKLIATKIGNHSCWFLSIPDSEWIKDKYTRFNGNKSEHGLVYDHDIASLLDLIYKQDLTYPDIPDAPFDGGIEYITGQGANDLERLEDAFHSMLALPSVGIDFETNALKPNHVRDPKLHLVSVGTFEKTYAFTLDHPEGWLTPQKRRRAWSAFAAYLSESNLKIAHNLHMEHTWASHFFGPQIMRLSEWGDTMAQAHTLDERQGTLNLDDNIRTEFGFFLKAQSDVDPVRLLEYPLLPVNAPRRSSMRYNAMDTKWAHALYLRRQPLIAANPAYQREYDRKVRLCPTLVMTEEKGLPVDMAYAKEMDKKFGDLAADLERKIARCPEVRQYEQKFGRFSPTAPEQVLTLMKDICKRDEVIEKDKSGKARETTEEDALAKIPREEVPSAHLILEHRGAMKVRSTSIEPILKGTIVSWDGLIHCTYNSMVAVSGRLSAQDPNVQNYPKRKYVEVRGVFYAPEGFTFLAADYGQIEARVVGMASEDRNLVKYLWTGYDIHAYWGARILKAYPRYKDYLIKEFTLNGDDDKKILKTARQEAKNKWVFPQFFGSSHKSCARDLHVPEDVAEDLMAEFWDEFQGVLKWQKRLLQKYERDLYVETLTGRRRRWAMTKNEIINHPIQGTAADIVLEAMCALSERSLVEENPDLQPNLNVHDDLSGIVPDDNHLTVHIDTLVREMCLPRFDFINVPLLVEVSKGPRWNELKEVAVYRSDDLFNIPNPYKAFK